MRLFRPIACAALVSSASACTLWYLASDPYKDADSSADAQGADAQADVQAVDVGPDAFSTTFQFAKAGVDAITVFQDTDTLYAKVGREIYTCTPTCSAMPVAVADAAAGGSGIAVNDSGLAWTVQGGIFIADVDGGNVREPITDGNNPEIVVADGPRLSWTTMNDAGAPLINSCANPRQNGKCMFAGIVGGPDGGAPAPKGDGGPVTLVGPDADVDPDKLAAGPTFVAWVSATEQAVTFTYVNNTFKAPPVPGMDGEYNQASTNTHVAGEWPRVFYSYYYSPGDQPNQLLVRREALPTDPTGTDVYRNKNMARNYCLAAGGGVVVTGGTKTSANSNGSLLVVDETDATAPTQLYFDNEAGAIACAATSQYVFVIDNAYQLHWARYR